jgi:hypothetical protein
MQVRSKSRVRAESSALTAQPTHTHERVGSLPAPESGLSLDPEELGAQFLSCAVEQSDSGFPAELDPEAELFEDSSAALLDVLGEPTGGPEWERALQRWVERGGESLVPIAAPPVPREFERASHAWDEVDLTDESIQEASLLDHEGDEFGAVEPPSALHTDDTHTHAKRRGGHLRGQRA